MILTDSIQFNLFDFNALFSDTVFTNFYLFFIDLPE